MNKRIAAALLILSLIGLAAFAQDKTNQTDFIKYGEKDWGVTFNVNGIIDNIQVNSVEDVNGNPSVLIRKFINKEWAVRVGFGLQSANINNQQVDSVGAARRDYDSTYRRTDFFLAPAVEYHFPGTKRLDPYAGLQMTIGAISDETIDVTINTSDTTGTSSLTRNYDLPGGFTFGMSLLAGFNYFISERLALGAEYQWGVLTSRTGGDFTIVTIERPISGASTTSRQVGTNRTTDTGFRMNGSAAITLTYYFNRNKKQGGSSSSGS